MGLYFHGGPLVTEFFASGSFWTRDVHAACDYAGGDEAVYALRIDPFRDLRYIDGQAGEYMTDDGFQDWPDQTREIEARLAEGYQAVGYDDGIWISAEALADRRVRRIR